MYCTNVSFDLRSIQVPSKIKIIPGHRRGVTFHFEQKQSRFVEEFQPFFSSICFLCNGTLLFPAMISLLVFQPSASIVPTTLNVEIKCKVWCPTGLEWTLDPQSWLTRKTLKENLQKLLYKASFCLSLVDGLKLKD